MRKFKIRTLFPPSANSIWRNARGKTYLSLEYKSFLQSVVNCCAETLTKHWETDAQYVVYIELHPSTRRKYDVDNRIKPVLDALTKAGVWDDDSQVVQVTAMKDSVQKSSPCAIVTVYALETQE